MTESLPSPVLDAPRLELALEAAKLGEFAWDLTRSLLIVSPRMARITGISAGQYSTIDTDVFYDAVHPDDRADVRAAIETAVNSSGHCDLDYRVIRPDDGRTIWIRATGSLERDDQGTPRTICGLVRDISLRKAAEDQRATLMAELDHRVKNVLSAVQVLAQQTAKRTPNIESFLAHFSGRLKAMASANELLTAARWRGAAISQLAEAELGGIAPGQAHWTGPDLFLTPRAANAIALALHELAINALKFGALSTDVGQVHLAWSEDADGGFSMTWIESGGPPVSPDPRLGFGSTLLRQVTGREVNGKVDVAFRAAGVRVRLQASPLAVVERPLPQGGKAARPIPDKRPVEADLSRLVGARVLVVEDAVLLAMELETGLVEVGAIVVGPAYELDEALALLDQSIDVAVLDANLNGRAVTPVADALTARGIPFLFATGYGENGGAPWGFDAPIIRKPYDIGDVAAAVSALLKA